LYLPTRGAPEEGKRYPASIQDYAPCYLAFPISRAASVVGRVIYCVSELSNGRRTMQFGGFVWSGPSGHLTRVTWKAGRQVSR
jgi:hypothetical protein